MTSYIAVHQDLIGENGPTSQEILGFLNAHPELVCRVWVEGEVVVYRMVWHPTGCPPCTPTKIAPTTYQIDLGEGGDEKFIGWS